MNSAPPGWYPNPDGSPTLRYWDGAAWTGNTSQRSEAAALPPPGAVAGMPAEAPPAGLTPSPYYGYTPAPPAGSVASSNSVGIAALVLGLLTIALVFFCALLAVPAGIAAVILGIVGVTQANRADPPASKGMAVAGIVLGGIGIAMLVGLVVLYLMVGSSSAYWG